ncbi:hypothetical protein ACGFIF_44240 [Kribbella sp. NPDC049174]|uniref:hypothetical protein n=1 Tax=Kribbella sp. NPDC049174 TaxID=3364112 RepID=UPI003723BB3E
MALDDERTARREDVARLQAEHLERSARIVLAGIETMVDAVLHLRTAIRDRQDSTGGLVLSWFGTALLTMFVWVLWIEADEKKDEQRGELATGVVHAAGQWLSVMAAKAPDRLARIDAALSQVTLAASGTRDLAHPGIRLHVDAVVRASREYAELGSGRWVFRRPGRLSAASAALADAVSELRERVDTGSVI